MSKKDEKKGGKPKISFDDVSKEIANLDHKQHIDQIGPAVTEVYIKHSKYTDNKGVLRYKQKFSKEEAENLANDVYDALAYHSHRRVFGLDQKKYEELKGFKDANGTPYIDAVTEFHYQINRDALKKTLARDDKDNAIPQGFLEKVLEQSVQHHAGLLTKGVISKHGLNDPEHFDALKSAIDQIVDKYKLNKKHYNTKKIHTPDEALKMYLDLSQKHYRDD